MKKIKIICTLGPSTFKRNILNSLKKESVDIFRINLSHTNIEDIKSTIKYLQKFKLKNICIDTEGAQIRTTKTNRKYFLKSGSNVIIANNNQTSDNKIINLYPYIDFKNVTIGKKIYIGFNNLSLKIISKNLKKNTLKCKILSSGYLESKKGVHFNTNVKLEPLTKKDIYALKISKNLNINNFAISFVNHHSDLKEVKKIVGNNVNIISKIETKNAIKDLENIINNSNSILIDRGDLSRYIPIETIPSAQEYIVKIARIKNTPTYVATNLLETMINESNPTRAESHDIYSTLKQGAGGLVLAAETAIGNHPLKCIKFLKKCIKSFNQKNLAKYLK